MVVLQEIITGRTCSLFAMAGEDDCPVHDFLKELMETDRNEFAKAMKLLTDTAENGPPIKNEQKCRFFREQKVFELKTIGGVRIMAFWDAGMLIVCTHGFMKKSQKTPAKQLERAAAARNQYVRAKQCNAIRRN